MKTAIRLKHSVSASICVFAALLGTGCAASTAPPTTTASESNAAPSGSASEADQPTRSKATEFLDSVTEDLSAKTDDEIAAAATTTVKTRNDGGYDKPSITTPEIKAAVTEELRAIGIDTPPGGYYFDPVQKTVLTGSFKYLYWADPSVQPFGLEQKEAEKQLGRPTADYLTEGKYTSTSCMTGLMIRTGSGTWASVRDDEVIGTIDKVMNIREVGTTPVKRVDFGDTSCKPVDWQKPSTKN